MPRLVVWVVMTVRHQDTSGLCPCGDYQTCQPSDYATSVRIIGVFSSKDEVVKAIDENQSSVQSQSDVQPDDDNNYNIYLVRAGILDGEQIDENEGKAEEIKQWLNQLTIY